MKTKMKFYRRFFSVLFVASLIIGCSKDGNDGPIGPQGAQGEQGPAGPQGADGADGADGVDGADGETGTANVIYSGWIASGFPANIANDVASFQINDPNITEQIRNFGVILVYGRVIVPPGGPPNWILALPCTFGQTIQESYRFGSAVPSQLSIYVESLINNADIGATQFSHYRYVLIPEGVSTSGKSSSLDYSKMTYEELAAHFGIKD